MGLAPSTPNGPPLSGGLTLRNMSGLVYLNTWDLGAVLRQTGLAMDLLDGLESMPCSEERDHHRDEVKRAFDSLWRELEQRRDVVEACRAHCRGQG
jgi:hypothetical protein